MLPRILLPLLLLAHAANSKNPLSGILMMKSQKETTAPNEAPAAPPEPVCVDPEALEAALKENKRLAAEVKIMKEEASSRIEQLDGVGKIHKDATDRLVLLNRQANDEIASLKKQLENKSAEIKTIEEKYWERAKLSKAAMEKQAKHQVDECEKRGAHIESELKRNFGLAQRQMEKEAGEAAKVEYEGTIQNLGAKLQQMERDYRASETDRLNIIGEKKALQDMYSTLEAKWEQKLAETEDEKQQFFAESFEKELAVREAEMAQKWRGQVEAAEKEKYKLLNNAEETAKVAFEEMKKNLVAEHKQKLDKLTKDHVAEMEKLEDELEEIETKNTDLDHELVTLKEKARKVQKLLKKRRQDAEYWEAAFETRSFVNVTYIIGGTKDFLSSSATHTSDLAGEGKDWVVKHALAFKDRVAATYKEYRPKVEKTIKPPVDAAIAFYKAYVKQHIDRTIDTLQPHYEKHLEPHIMHAMQVATPYKDRFMDDLKLIFDKLVDGVKWSCPPVLQVSEKTVEKVSFLEPVKNHVQLCCDHPDIAVMSFLQSLVLTAIIAFFFEILDILIYLLWLLLAPFLFPFRLILRLVPRKPAPVDDADSDANGVNGHEKED